MKWVMILLMLVLTLCMNTAHAIVFFFEGGLPPSCNHAFPTDPNLVVLIYEDVTGNGPDSGDIQPCVGDEPGCVNFNSFELSWGYSPEWVTYDVPEFTQFYLIACASSARHYTVTLSLHEMPDLVWFGGEDGFQVFCEGAPSTPSSLWTSDDNCDGITITWHHNLLHTSGFEIWRDSVLTHTFDSVPQTLEYFDEEAGVGEHNYLLTAFLYCGDGRLYSVASNHVTGVRAGPPLAIDHIWIDTTQGIIRICWTDVENEDGYRILRNGTMLDILNSNSVSYDDFGPPPGTNCLYQVIPFNQCGDGPAASVIWVPPAEPVLTVDPPVLDFGEVNINAEYSATIVLTNIGETELWLGFDIGQGLFNITYIGGDSLPSGDSMEVDISFYADIVGEYNDTLQVEYSPERDPLLIPLRADARRFLIGANYTSINFFVPWGGTSFETLTLSNVGDLDVVIDTVYFDAFDNMFSVTPRSAVLPAGSQQDFQITATLSAYFANAVLHFVHNVPPDLELCIPVAAELDPGDADEQLSGVPKDYFLDNAYPNPFNPSTTISFGLPQESHVALAVFDIFGRLIQTLSNRTLPAGVHSIEFDGANLPSGVYFYRLTANQYTASHKMVLLK